MFQGNSEVVKRDGRYTVEAALEDSRREAGLVDFGDDDFLEPLEAFVECVQNDVDFSEMGDLSFRSTVQRFLVNRLRLHRDITAHPEILDEDVSDPIMIMGMPRTGTTKLQRLMSADPQMQKLSLWRLLNPAPFDGEEPGDPRPAGRLAFAKAVEDATRANADFTTSHETGAEEADEDAYLSLLSFEYPIFFTLYPSHSWLKWVRERPRTGVHRWEKKLLQYLQWQDGGRKGRRWVLKDPASIGFLAPFHEVFPNATIVHSHRDMIEVMPSFCRLMETGKSVFYKELDPLQHAEESVEFWSHEMAKYHADLAALGDKINVIDVPYLDIVRDPFPVIERIYSAAGIKLNDESRAAMESWAAANQQHKHGKADYSLERYGLTPEIINNAFPNQKKF